MMGIMLLTQGDLAKELLISARAIAGGLEDCKAVCLDWSDGLEEGRVKVQAALDELAAADDAGILILTDMYGGTPCNVAVSFREAGRIEVLAGVNLPMVVRLGCLCGMNRSVAEIAEWLREKGRGSICVAESKSERCCSSEPQQHWQHQAVSEKVAG